MSISRLFGEPGARFTRIGRRLLLVSVPIRTGPEAPEVPSLTKAERSVVELAASGFTIAAIAKRRQRSPGTITKQLAAAYRKLGVSSRPELAKKLGK